MTKKNMMLGFILSALVVAGASLGSLTSKGYTADALDQNYTLSLTNETVKLDELGGMYALVGDGTRKIHFSSTVAPTSGVKPGTLGTYPAGAVFSNDTQINGIKQLNVTFTGKMKINWGFNKLASGDKMEQTKYLAREGFNFYNGDGVNYEHFEFYDERPSYFELVFEQDTYLTSMQIVYDCNETIDDRFTNEWRIVTEANGFKETASDVLLKLNTKANFEINKKLGVEYFAADVELTKGTVFKLFDSKNNAWSNGTCWNTNEGSAFFDKDLTIEGNDSNIVVNKTGKYSFYFKGLENNGQTWVSRDKSGDKPVNPEVKNVDFFYTNPNNWPGVKAYAWDGDVNNGAFPGQIMDIDGKYYKITLDVNKYKNVIFSDLNDASHKTDNLTLPTDNKTCFNGDGWYVKGQEPALPVDPETSGLTLSLVGSINGWDTANNDYPLVASEDKKTYTTSITTYKWTEFKVIKDHKYDTQYGFEALDKESVDSNLLGQSGTDETHKNIQILDKGTYAITFTDGAEKPLNIKRTAEYNPVFSLVGSMNEWNHEKAPKLTYSKDNEWEIKDVALKVNDEFQIWGDEGTKAAKLENTDFAGITVVGNNFKVAEEGTYNIYYKADKQQCYIEKAAAKDVTYSLVGSMNDWAPEKAPKLTQSKDKVNEREIKNLSLTAGNEFQIWGSDGTKTAALKNEDYKDIIVNGNNFKVEKTGAYNIYYDIDTKKCYIENYVPLMEEKLITLYVTNVPKEWKAELSLHAFGGAKGDLNGKWPGKAMTLVDEATKTYKVEFDAANYPKFIVNDNGQGQQSKEFLSSEWTAKNNCLDLTSNTWVNYTEASK